MSTYMNLTLSMNTVRKIADELYLRSVRLRDPQRRQFCRDMSAILRDEITKALQPIDMRKKKNVKKK